MYTGERRGLGWALVHLVGMLIAIPIVHIRFQVKALEGMASFRAQSRRRSPTGKWRRPRSRQRAAAISDAAVQRTARFDKFSRRRVIQRLAQDERDQGFQDDLQASDGRRCDGPVSGAGAKSFTSATRDGITCGVMKMVWKNVSAVSLCAGGMSGGTPSGSKRLKTPMTSGIARVNAMPKPTRSICCAASFAATARTPCPTEAIELGHEHQMSFTDRRDAIYTKDMLIDPPQEGAGDTPQQVEPGVYTRSIPDMEDPS